MKRTRSKKLIILFAVFLTFAVSLSVFAFTTLAAAVHMEFEDFEQYGGTQVGGANVQTTETGEIVVGCKPEEVGIECYTELNAELAEAGTYTFKICYAASESPDYARKGDLILNGKRYNLPITATPDWNTFNVVSIEAELEAGPLNIKVASPEDYDNATVKTCNFDWIEYELTKKAAEPEVVEVTSNPSTGDLSFGHYISALCVLCFAVFLIGFRRVNR